MCRTWNVGERYEDILKVLSDCISGKARPAKDGLLENGTEGGMGGAFSKFGAARIEGEVPDRADSARDRKRMAADSAVLHSGRTLDRLAAKYPGIQRIRTN
jgi:hypothetical protein